MEFCTEYLQPLGENEAFLKLPARDATMEKRPIMGFVLAAANDQLIVLESDRKVAGAKSSYSQRNRDPLFSRMFDVVRGIAVLFDGALKQPFDFVEAQ